MQCLAVTGGARKPVQAVPAFAIEEHFLIFGKGCMPCANWPPAWSRSQHKGSEQLHPPLPGPSEAEAVPQAAPPLRLSCHCGATTAECTEAPLFTYYCHCSSCQQLPGAAFCHNAQFSPDQVLRERLICGHHTPYRSCFGNYNTSLVFLPKGA